MFFSLSPQGLPAYSTVDWASVLAFSTYGISVASAFYSPSTERLVLDFTYNTTISGESTSLALNSANSFIFSGVVNFSASTSTRAANNAALLFYEDYGTSNIVKYLAITTAVLAVLLFLAAFFGGRLVALECLAVVQLTFMGLLSV